jgi:N-acetylglucosamine malate deacetylase 1
MKVLVIAAHPDDEVIGAGGAIARHVARGDEVSWCVVTEGYDPPWPKPVLEAARTQVHEVRESLGIARVFFCGFPTVKLNTVPYRELSSALQGVVDEVRPEIVYTTPGNDVNQDHRLVFESTLVATRPLPGSSVRRLLCYEIGPTAGFGTPNSAVAFAPNVFVDISRFLEAKLNAMRCYGTELREYPHPRSLQAIELFARERGLRVGLAAAECFELIRELS